MRTKNGTRGRWILVAGIGALVALGTSPTPAHARNGTRVDLRQGLAPTAADPDAVGKVRFRLRGSSDARLLVIGSRLERRASFDVLVGGVKVGSLVTGGSGGGRLRFRSDPKRVDALLGFDPRGKTIAIRNSRGDDVLSGSVSDESDDPTKVGCCLPDDSGTECEDRTEEDCRAAGGDPSGTSSCLPDPCAPAPSPGEDDDRLCCIPDDSGAECEDRSVADCATAGGTVVAGSSCAPDSCVSIPDPGATPTPDETPSPEDTPDDDHGGSNEGPGKGGHGGQDD